MYIWRVGRLVADFRSGSVSERQQLNYLLVFVALTYVISDPYVNGLLEYETLNQLDLILFPILLTIAIVGTVLCYRVSGPPFTNAGFLPRYICLGIPVVIRVITIVVAIVMFVFLINEFVFGFAVIDLKFIGRTSSDFWSMSFWSRTSLTTSLKRDDGKEWQCWAAC